MPIIPMSDAKLQRRFPGGSGPDGFGRVAPPRGPLHPATAEALRAAKLARRGSRAGPPATPPGPSMSTARFLTAPAPIPLASLLPQRPVPRPALPRAPAIAVTPPLVDAGPVGRRRVQPLLGT